MVYLHAVASCYPDNVLSNQFFDELNIGSDSQWILERVGIRERRTVLPLEYIRDTYNKNPLLARDHSQQASVKLIAAAAKTALERANLQPSDIGLVIAGSSAPEYAMPAAACVIAAELGITATSYDVNSICSTFVAHCHLISQMQAESLPDYCLLLLPESWTWSFDYTDRQSAVLAGDCFIATIVSKRHKSNFVIDYTSLWSSPSGWNKIVLPAGSHFAQDGSVVQRFAIRETRKTIQEVRRERALDPSQHYFIGHQANLLMLQTACNKEAITEEKHLYNVDQYGNCAAAGAPSVLAQNWDRFKAGDNILMAVVGSGLTWGGLLIKVLE